MVATSSRTLCAGSSGDESLVSGGRGGGACSSGEEALVSGGKGERVSGDRILGTGPFGAASAAGRLRGGEGDRDDVSPVRSTMDGG